MFVDRVDQLDASQEWVRGFLRRSHQIAAHVSFGLTDAKKFVRPPLRIVPDPAMSRPKTLTRKRQILKSWKA